MLILPLLNKTYSPFLRILISLPNKNGHREAEKNNSNIFWDRLLLFCIVSYNTPTANAQCRTRGFGKINRHRWHWGLRYWIHFFRQYRPVLPWIVSQNPKRSKLRNQKKPAIDAEAKIEPLELYQKLLDSKEEVITLQKEEIKRLQDSIEGLEK